MFLARPGNTFLAILAPSSRIATTRAMFDPVTFSGIDSQPIGFICIIIVGFVVKFLSEKSR